MAYCDSYQNDEPAVSECSECGGPVDEYGVTTPQPAEQQPHPDTLIGRTVSMDVSTGDHNAFHRLFGTVVGVEGQDGVILCELDEDNQDKQPAPAVPEIEPYDAGFLNDFGGGDVGWWHGYIRSELDRAHEFYLTQLETALQSQDRDAERLLFACEFDAYTTVRKDRYEYAFECAQEAGREEPTEEDELNGLRRLIDAAIAAHRKQGDEL